MKKFRELKADLLVHTDETYIHSKHTQAKDWVEKDGPTLKKPDPKGRRLIIVLMQGVRWAL